MCWICVAAASVVVVVVVGAAASVVVFVISTAASVVIVVVVIAATATATATANDTVVLQERARRLFAGEEGKGGGRREEGSERKREREEGRKKKVETKKRDCTPTKNHSFISSTREKGFVGKRTQKRVCFRAHLGDGCKSPCVGRQNASGEGKDCHRQENDHARERHHFDVWTSLSRSGDLKKRKSAKR